jgi:hypothetical protein
MHTYIHTYIQKDSEGSPQKRRQSASSVGVADKSDKNHDARRESGVEEERERIREEGQTEELTVLNLCRCDANAL